MQELINTVHDFFASHSLSSLFSGLGAALVVFLIIAMANEQEDDDD